jgi:hypothetical protein
MNGLTAYKFFLPVLLVLLPTLAVAQYPLREQKQVITPQFAYYTQTDYFDGDGKVIKRLKGSSFNT